MPVVVYATIARDPSFLNISFYLREKINAVHEEGQLLYKAYCKEAQKIEHDGDPTARSAALKAVHDYYDTTYKLALEEAYTIHTQGAFKPLPEGKYRLRFPPLKVTGAALQAHFHEQVQVLLDAYGELLFHFEIEP